MVLFDFNPDQDITPWEIVDDVVMGGQSEGHFKLNDAGNALFSGTVSLENNGGFSSVRYQFQPKEVSAYTQVQIRLKGDGKPYQFRIKSQASEEHSYVQEFETTGDWEIIELRLSDFYPTYRGMKLRRPNYSGETMEEIAFLIGNQKAETFALELDWIKLK